MLIVDAQTMTTAEAVSHTTSATSLKRWMPPVLALNITALPLFFTGPIDANAGTLAAGEQATLIVGREVQ